MTPLGGGNFHYEYAVHNVDNSRAGASLRIPIDASATATNFTFGDIDTDASNDWSVQRVGNEIVFSATANNPLEWNTIYNFGFDADFTPGISMCEIDEARIGPGNMFVEVETEVPGGSTIPLFAKFGTPCDGSSIVPEPICAQFNPAGGQLIPIPEADEFVYRVGTSGTLEVESFDVWTQSTGGNVMVEARIYEDAGLPPQGTPIATTMMTITATEGFHTATFNPPVTVNGAYYIGFDNTAQNVYVSNLVSGSGTVSYSRSGAAAPVVAQHRPGLVLGRLRQPGRVRAAGARQQRHAGHRQQLRADDVERPGLEHRDPAVG